MRAILLVLYLLVPLLAGCGQKARETEQASIQPAAAEVAEVGEGMCAEHGVLEAICTKCKPQLIPIFQAKGDWCAEHGFPMSICPTHHPERGGRPAVDVAIDEAPASGTKIRFKTMETARDAGIETVAAVEGMQGSGVFATATLVTDASHVAVVNPPASGVVRAIRADLGTRVARGTPLAVLESSTLAGDRSQLQAARARATLAESNARRARELFDRGVVSLRDVEEANRESEAAKADVAAASGALTMIGASDGTAGSYTLRAPIAGVVTRREATVGTLVDIDDALFEIVDTSQLWADIDVPESQVSRVKVGQRVVLRVEGLKGHEFHGTLKFISPVIDPQTRTAKARAALANPDGLLRANMYARARVVDDENVASILVPKAAVQQAKGIELVFVQLALDSYEARRVESSPADNGMVAISSDVRPGDRVVTTGSFLLKTETLKESIGAGCCEIESPKK